MQERQWITARRSELDALAEQLTKQLQEVQVERDELAIAERVLNRLAEQAQADAEAVAPVAAQVAGRAVLLIPHRSDAADEGALPGDYRKILATHTRSTDVQSSRCSELSRRGRRGGATAAAARACARRRTRRWLRSPVTSNAITETVTPSSRATCPG
ncbi:hypothetical protein WBG99_20710 [Streptomyces sp. TG1A-60]|uniref:hypothetical protein n=1 Tax=Streptomyces sp. TG1A-60 TaxID=3129111 RepID=UPI0030CACE81